MLGLFSSPPIVTRSVIDWPRRSALWTTITPLAGKYSMQAASSGRVAFFPVALSVKILCARAAVSASV